ncbi:glycoside hydrolase family 13 protein [Phycicoccus sp. CSK15P-2]|uniref:glycoside hydrolase family 13 protein n=1 Tax=Phycicoccus sp. CSK15P-2 TaxID=2807627 RepID=UPI00195017BB|nr:glycoside hydrolase family 13 protein [Phycicoccus sp. CSK15P-2]MBM6403208.1 glycoside hydrolase family 13 protein [Phycicoccus sp. CSK15P-2]
MGTAAGDVDERAPPVRFEELTRQTVPSPGGGDAAVSADWWRGATIYQVYPRSFADADGDGSGDLAGVRSRLGYLADLGVDAIWLTPWYPSPMADGGYDVADYRAIDPAFGDLAEAEGLIADAFAMGIRTIIDVVPNHVSSEHAWFRAAVAAGPGSPERDRFWFRDGRGPRGEQPPNGWTSNFGGGAWTRLTSPEGTPEQWYLHLFAPGQPDLNWDHPDVRREYQDILRFWFDRGVAGIRIDSAALLAKDPRLPDLPDGTPDAGAHPYVDRDELQDIYRGWRRIGDSYGGDRVLIGEIWLADVDRFVRYLRPDILHSAFNFDFMTAPWDARRLRRSIESTISAHAVVGAPPTWVLSNHDVTRPVTRYGRTDTAFAFDTKRFGTPTDLGLGTRRARAAALLAMALPGAYYLYQGDELGLPEVEELPLERLQDPMYARSGGVDPGRDGCRVPIPWSGDIPPYGFGAAGGRTWLPQPDDWGRYTVNAQLNDPDSMLSLHRDALRLRRDLPDLGDGALEWVRSEPEVIAFRRGPDLVCVTNLGTSPAHLPRHTGVWVTSRPMEGGRLPPDTTAWLRLRH